MLDPFEPFGTKKKLFGRTNQFATKFFFIVENEYIGKNIVFGENYFFCETIIFLLKHGFC